MSHEAILSAIFGMITAAVIALLFRGCETYRESRRAEVYFQCIEKLEDDAKCDRFMPQ